MTSFDHYYKPYSIARCCIDATGSGKDHQRYVAALALLLLGGTTPQLRRFDL